jgi:hypothetical protein
MWVWVAVGAAALAGVLGLLFWIMRPIAGGMTLEDWTARNELVQVARKDGEACLLPNGWYQLCDEDELCDQLTVSCIGRTFVVKRDAKNVTVEDESGRAWLVDRSHTMVLVWYDAEGREPTYRIGEAKEAVPSDMVCHGKVRHVVRCLLQDVFENGADYAHFHAVHEDGAKAFGWLGALLRLKLIFQGHWDVNPDMAECSAATVDNHLQVFGHDVQRTKQTVRVHQVGPTIAFEDLQRGVLTDDRIFLVQSTTPIGPYVHVEQTRFFSAPGLLNRLGVKLFAHGFTRNLENDILMQNNKLYLPKPVVVAGDGPIVKFRRWYAQFYSPNTPRTVAAFYGGAEE